MIYKALCVGRYFIIFVKSVKLLITIGMLQTTLISEVANNNAIMTIFNAIYLHYL